MELLWVTHLVKKKKSMVIDKHVANSMLKWNWIELPSAEVRTQFHSKQVATLWEADKSAVKKKILRFLWAQDIKWLNLIRALIWGSAAGIRNAPQVAEPQVLVLLGLVQGRQHSPSSAPQAQHIAVQCLLPTCMAPISCRLPGAAAVVILPIFHAAHTALLELDYTSSCRHQGMAARWPPLSQQCGRHTQLLVFSRLDFPTEKSRVLVFLCCSQEQTGDLTGADFVYC